MPASGVAPIHEYCVLIGEVHDVDYKVEALVDSGSKISIMKKSALVENFPKSDIVEEAQTASYGGVNRSQLTIYGFAVIRIRVHLLPRASFVVRFAIVPDSTMIYDALLGRDFMMRPGLLVTFGLAMQMKYSEPENDVTQLEVFHKTRKIDSIEEAVSKVEYKFQKKLVCIFNRFLSRRSFDPLTYRVNLKLRSKVTPKQKLPVLTEQCWIQVRAIIDDLLRNKIVQPSESDYVNPIRVKGHGTKLKLYPDFSHLKKHLRLDLSRPMFEGINPQRLAAKTFFTMLSLRMSHANILLNEASRKYTCFATNDGRYEFIRLPFCLKVNRAVIQKYLSVILKSLLENETVFLDRRKLVIATETVEQNLQALEKTLILLETNGIALHLHECRFLLREVAFWNYNIKRNCVVPLRSLIQSVSDFSAKTDGDAEEFLALAYRFAYLDPNFKQIVETLRQSWIDCGLIETLKKSLTQSPMLANYSSRAATKVFITSDNRGFWSVLAQLQIDAQFHPVCYLHRRFSVDERGICLSKLSAVIVNYTLKKFHLYLSQRPFTIVTDTEFCSRKIKNRTKEFSFKIECVKKE